MSPAPREEEKRAQGLKSWSVKRTTENSFDLIHDGEPVLMMVPPEGGDYFTEPQQVTVEAIASLFNSHSAQQAKVEGLVRALQEAVDSAQTVVNMMHECADPKLERPFVWKDVALQMYACMADLPKWRAALQLAQTEEKKS